MRNRLFLVSALMLMGCGLYAATNLFPGLTYYDESEQLNGKLVFRLNMNELRFMGLGTNAVIYEYDLRDKILRKVAQCRGGEFIPSTDGNLFCVNYFTNPTDSYDGVSSTVYSASDGKSRDLGKISGQFPDSTVIIDGHVFFCVRAESGYYRILDYDFKSGIQHVVELPKASVWEGETYKSIHRQPGKSNVLHFEYWHGSKKQLKPGLNYERGFYAMNVQTGDVVFYAKRDTEWIEYRLFNGRYVYFEGRDSPWHGIKLVSSPWSSDDVTHRKDPKEEQVKALNKFPYSSNSYYTLRQLSPCRKYVFVMQEKTVLKFNGLNLVTTYYIVDGDGGATRLLLKVDHDDIKSSTGGDMSPIYWVGNGAEGQ